MATAKRAVTLDELKQNERDALLEYGTRIPIVAEKVTTQNNINHTRVFKKISKDFAYYVSDFILTDFKGFENSNSPALKEFYHGNNLMILRLLDYDIVIFYRETGSLLPVNEMAVSKNKGLEFMNWKSYTESIEVRRSDGVRIAPPKQSISDNVEYWFYSGGSERLGKIASRDDYFDEVFKMFGTLLIWELPLRTDQVIIGYCPERPVDIMPAAIDNDNKVIGIYYKEFIPMIQ